MCFISNHNTTTGVNSLVFNLNQMRTKFDNKTFFDEVFTHSKLHNTFCTNLNTINSRVSPDNTTFDKTAIVAPILDRKLEITPEYGLLTHAEINMMILSIY